MELKRLSAPKSLGRDLTFAASATSAVCNRLLEPHGLTLAQWAVLSCLWRNGSLAVKEIAELTGNAPPAASRIVDRMVASGLLERTQDPADRRAVTVALSDKAERLRPLQSIYKEVNAIVTADLNAAEAEALFSLLARVNRTARTWLDTGGR